MSKNSIRTARQVAKKASDLLRDKRTGKKTKTVAGSAMANRKKHS